MDKLALFNPEIRKIGLIREFFQKNPTYTLIDYSMERKFEEEKNNHLEGLKDFESESNAIPDMITFNIKDLSELTTRALEDYNRSMNVEYTSDLEIYNDRLINSKNFFKHRCKTYARDISGIIDALLLNEGFPYTLFMNYKEYTRLCLDNDGEVSAHYLRNLISVARSAIAVPESYIEPSVASSAFTSNNNAPEFGSK